MSGCCVDKKRGAYSDIWCYTRAFDLFNDGNMNERIDERESHLFVPAFKRGLGTVRSRSLV